MFAIRCATNAHVLAFKLAFPSLGWSAAQRPRQFFSMIVKNRMMQTNLRRDLTSAYRQGSHGTGASMISGYLNFGCSPRPKSGTVYVGAWSAVFVLISSVRRCCTGSRSTRGAPSAGQTHELTNVTKLDDSFKTLEQTKAMVKNRSWPAEHTLSVSDFLDKMNTWRVRGKLPAILDVRAPIEFERGHIPGAINLPLLNNLDRAAVGTLYKQVGRDEAFEYAISRVHPALGQMLQSVAEACGDVHRHLLVYCLRGGQRSQSVARFLSDHGYDVFTLSGGYKTFKAWAQLVLERPQKVCMIGGATGSGKTEVLAELKLLGAQVVDLEALAHHKGSVFGHLGEDPQPTSEHFRNQLATEWSALDQERFVFLEDEGATIGKVHLPASIYQRMRAAQAVLRLEVSFELRVQRLLAVYGPHGSEKLADAVRQFSAGSGEVQTKELLSHLSRGELRPVCEAALRNYDKMYTYHLKNQRNADRVQDIQVSSLDSQEVARAVLAAAASLEPTVPSRPDAVRSVDEQNELALQEARCYCGAHAVLVAGDPQSVSICHCSTCRQLSGAPFIVSALFKSNRVTVTAPDGSDPVLVETKTSSRVRRQRCGKCFAPLFAELSGRRAVPLVLFSWEGAPPVAWQPRHHLHYDSRVMDMHDELPKFKRHAGSDQWEETVGTAQ